jgi:stringent starvation protein B
MTRPPGSDAQGSSTRPYLIRALHDWCTDNGFTPYVAVFVDRTVQVPVEYVKNNEIVLNVGFEATSGLKLGNDYIEFRARFGGVARDIVVPVDHVVAIYARENGQGMAFPAPNAAAAGGDQATAIEARPETVARGLRLASSEDAVQDAGPSSRPVPFKGRSTDEPPAPDTPPPAGGRPKLKRVK